MGCNCGNRTPSYDPHIPRAPNGGTREQPWCKECKWVMLRCNVMNEKGERITEFSCVNMRCKLFQKPQYI